MEVSLTTAALTDDQLLEQFEQCSLPAELFHHAEHVRVAFLYLQRGSVLDALQNFSASLRRFAKAQGKEQRYHETVTWACMFLIHERMLRARPQTWTEFERANPDLLDWKANILKRYYREETLSSDLARAIFVLPDRDAKRGPEPFSA